MQLINSAEEMFEFGKNLGSKLKAGDLVLLSGPLGSGKTALTKGIGATLGFKNITSPTFVISKIYKGTPNLIHVDAYRLQGEAHALFDDLDLESYLPNSVCVIEWGEGLISRIAEKYLEIGIEFTEIESQRKLTIKDHSSGISV